MRDVLLAGVIAASGGIKSRVKLQKMAYLLQRLGFDLGFHDFGLRQYGPFSIELAGAIDSITQGIVTESQEDLGQASSGDRVVRYSYAVGDPDLQTFLLEVLDESFPGGLDQLHKAATQLAQQDRGVLEVAATALYIEDELGVQDEHEIWEQVRRRKPHLQRRFSQARELVNNLRSQRWSPHAATG